MEDTAVYPYKWPSILLANSVHYELLIKQFHGTEIQWSKISFEGRWKTGPTGRQTGNQEAPPSFRKWQEDVENKGLRGK